MLQKLKTELNNLWHSSQTIVSSKGTIFAKNAFFLQKKKKKKMLASTKLRGPRTERYIFWNSIYVYKFKKVKSLSINLLLAMILAGNNFSKFLLVNYFMKQFVIIINTTTIPANTWALNKGHLMSLETVKRYFDWFTLSSYRITELYQHISNS